MKLRIAKGEIFPVVCLSFITLCMVSCTVIILLMAWIDFSKNGISFTVVAGPLAVVIMVALTLFIIWKLFGSELLKKVDSCPKVDRKTHKLLDQQTNLGNRIYNEFQDAAARDSRILVEKIPVDVPYQILVNWHEPGFDCLRFKVAGWRIIHVNLSVESGELYVFFYAGSRQKVDSKTYKLVEIDIAISDMKSHIQNWRLE